jgi:hypothetical protein
MSGFCMWQKELETNSITAARSIFLLPLSCEQLKYDLFYLSFHDRIFMRDFISVTAKIYKKFVSL